MSAPKAAAIAPADLARRSKSSFLWSFAFLERRRRRGLAAIYAFCRAVDDAVDEAADPDTGRQQIGFWRAELARVQADEPTTAIGRELAWTMREFGMATTWLRDVVDGVAMDLEPLEFADLAALDGYCRKVASAVGHACLPVFGAHGNLAERYADRLGLALQMTNILRDLRADAELGRIYVPRDRLAAAAVRPEWVRGDGPRAVYANDGPVARMVDDLATVAHERFAEAASFLPAEQRRALVPAEIMAAIYYDLLRRVERRAGRIDDPARLSVPRSRKLWLALRTWCKGRR
jgi:phytoene synthase